MYSHE
jgi:hypothetical protein